MNRTAGPPWRAWLGALSLLCLLAAPLLAGDEPTPPSVLIVTPEPDGLAEEFRALLDKYAIPSTVVKWEAATVERARDFDLVMVVGAGRTITGEVELEFDRPVLGVGPYGCKYFGLMRLKNGHPHT